ncbi:MAG: hypothetical protein ACYCZN_01445 [Candidatus Dormibacteria bacterium]
MRFFVGGMAVLSMLGITSCGSTPNYVTGPARALQIAQAYNRNNAKANFTLNTALQNKNEEGVSAEMDDTYYQMLRDEGKHSEGNGKPASWHFTVHVFNQAATPAYFVAETAGTKASKGSGNLFLFAKDSPKSPWRVLYEPDGPTSGFPGFVSVGNGYVAAGPPAKRLVTTPKGAVSDLATYWAGYSASSTALGLLQAGQFTSGFGGTERSDVTSFAANTKGYGSEAISASVDSAPIISFLTTNGALVFGAIDVAYTFQPGQPGSGRYLLQNAARTNFGALLPPGQYSSNIILNYVSQVALLVPKSGKIRVLGWNWGPVSANGQ